MTTKRLPLRVLRALRGGSHCFDADTFLVLRLHFVPWRLCVRLILLRPGFRPYIHYSMPGTGLHQAEAGAVGRIGVAVNCQL
jgi:hypothetical protein